MKNIIFRLAICSLSFTVLVTVPTNGVTEARDDLRLQCSKSHSKSLQKSEICILLADNKYSSQAILNPFAQVEKVAIDFQFTEGPLLHRSGFLLFSDIPANTIL